MQRRLVMLKNYFWGISEVVYQILLLNSSYTQEKRTTGIEEHKSCHEWKIIFMVVKTTIHQWGTFYRMVMKRGSRAFITSLYSASETEQSRCILQKHTTLNHAELHNKVLWATETKINLDQNVGRKKVWRESRLCYGLGVYRCQWSWHFDI